MGRLIEFVADIPLATRTPLLRAGAARFSGLLAARHGNAEQADEQLIDAIRELRGIDGPYVLAQILLERAELLHTNDRGDEATALNAEATEIFTRLRATPYLERVQKNRPQASATS